MKFSERLNLLGFKTYNDYLLGDHWKSFKSRYRKSGRSVSCAVCGSNSTQFHHRTYERLGNEGLDDVIPLCRKHHEDVHSKLKEAGLSVGGTDKIVKNLCKDSVVVSVPKIKRTKHRGGNRGWNLDAIDWSPEAQEARRLDYERRKGKTRQWAIQQSNKHRKKRPGGSHGS